MSSTALNTLQEYVKGNTLHKVYLSSNGETLSFEEGEAIDATMKHTILDDKVYSLASLFLLCKYPSLISYRKACKQYNIDDIVKASDRVNVLGYFNLNQQQQQQQQDDDIDMIDQQQVENKQQKESSKHQHHHQHRHDKDRRSKEKDKVSSSHSHKKHGKKIAQEQGGKKEKAPMTNEQIMQNLAIVAGKRGENRKVKADDVTMMQEMADVTHSEAINIKDDPDKDTPDVSQSDAVEEAQLMPAPAATASSVPAETTSNSEEDSEKLKILNALSAKGYEANEELVNNDRTATDLIFSKEQPVGDSASILCFSSRDFTRVLELYIAVKKQEEVSSHHHHRHPPSKSKSKSSSSSRPQLQQQPPNKKSKPSTNKKPSGLPIIIIPNAMTSPVTMINAEEFLKSAKFTPRDVVIKKLGGLRNIKKSGGSGLTITRNVSSRFGGGNITFEVIDNPIMKLKHSSDWDRIVAVVAQGAEWQFKGWKHTQPVDIFNRTFGFYVGYEGAPVPKEILQWNVKLGYVHRDKRGLDSVTFSSFWNCLDEWIAVHKPEYLPKDPIAL